MTIQPIAWDWNPRSQVCFVDLETQSAVDLRKAGNWKYVTDRSTRLLSAVFKVPGGEPITWVPRPISRLSFPGLVTGDEIPEAVQRLASTHVFVAHNAEGFDALVWARLFPESAPRWRDTQPMARALGLPGSLDKLSRWFGGAGKTDAGSRAMKLLTKQGVKGTLPLWRTLLKYNVDDVVMLESIYTQLAPVLKFHAKYLDVHSRTNDHGIKVDSHLAMKLIHLWNVSKAESRDVVSELTGGELTVDNIRSGPATHRWLKKQGVELDSLRREEIDAFLNDPEIVDTAEAESLALVVEVLKHRSHVTRTGETKLDRLLNSIVDGRLRYWAVYHGAATGRYSSRGVQMHNLPRGDPKLDVAAWLDAAEPPLGDDPATTLNTLTRSCFVADTGEELLISDFSAIEARCLAWMADELRMLEQYRNNEDLYLDMASQLFGRTVTKADKLERHIGKQIILGAGYGMSGDRFEVYCRLQKVDLAAHGLTGAACIKAYRDGYQAVPRLWKHMDKAAIDCVLGRGDQVAGRCRFSMRDAALVVTLPSGRDIYYQRAMVVKRVPYWAVLKRKSVPPQDTLIYTHPQGYEKTLYGALIVENCLAGSTQVLTQRGPVPITQVTASDLVWDGIEWVDTSGCISRGQQEVGTWLGLSVTGSHLIHDGSSWSEVTRLDETSSTQCLKSALDSMSSPSFAAMVDGVSIQSAAVANSTTRQQGTCLAPKSSSAQLVPDVTAGLCTLRRQSYLTHAFALCGSIDTQAWWPDAITHSTEPTTTMVAEASQSVMSGKTTALASWPMQPHYPGGMSSGSIWTGSTTRDTMSLATSGLSSATQTHGTLARLSGSVSTVCTCISKTSGSNTFQSGHTQRSVITTTRAGLLNGSWVTTGRLEPVFDLLNCGPRNRFTVITDAGPVLVHNCDQAICSDLLREAQVRYDKAGLKTVVHVHDELVVSAPRSQETMNKAARIMAKVPRWAAGFPVAVEGFSCPVYVKNPWKESLHASAS